MLSTLLLPLLLGIQAQDRAQSANPVHVTVTNEEQVYFEREAGRVPPPWVGFQVRRIGANETILQRVDAFGAPIGVSRMQPSADLLTAQRLETVTDGQLVIFNRARPFTCWVSVRRHADRASGEADWSFDRNLAIHDQGGRVLVQPEGAPPVVIRMRNVVWPPPSTNRPSLVLYVHRPESPDRAESYGWADPDARMVGINLRWMQASCTRVGDAS